MVEMMTFFLSKMRIWRQIWKSVIISKSDHITCILNVIIWKRRPFWSFWCVKYVVNLIWYFVRAENVTIVAYGKLIDPLFLKVNWSNDIGGLLYIAFFQTLGLNLVKMVFTDKKWVWIWQHVTAFITRGVAGVIGMPPPLPPPAPHGKLSLTVTFSIIFALNL